MSFINYSVKMRVTPEESEAVQKICFKNGVAWSGFTSNVVRLTEHPYLYIYTNDGIKFGETESHFVNSLLPEFTAEDFILTDGTMDFEKYNTKEYTHGKSFEIIEPTSNNIVFINSLNKIYEKYQNHIIEIQYGTTTNHNIIYKSALVIITPKSGLNI